MAQSKYKPAVVFSAIGLIAIVFVLIFKEDIKKWVSSTAHNPGKTNNPGTTTTTKTNQNFQAMDPVYSTVNSLNVRRSPSTTAEILGKKNKGELIGYYAGEQNGWVAISDVLIPDSFGDLDNPELILKWVYKQYTTK